MLAAMMRLLMMVALSMCAIAGGIAYGHALPGGVEIALTSSDMRSNRARTSLMDIRATLTYRLPLRLGANSFIDWVTEERFLLRQAGNRPSYLMFEIGRSAQVLRLPDECREGSLRGRGDLLSCTGRQGGGLLIFSYAWALQREESPPLRYVPGALVAEHVWSPDGSQIAFVDIAVHTSGLALLDVGDARVSRIADSVAGVAAKISWSADSRQVAYYTAQGMSLSLQVYDVVAETTILALPLNGAALDEPPSWSPDGSQLALFQYDNFGADIFTVDVQQRAIRWLTQGKGASAYPRWSPNGELLAYYVNTGGQMHLFLADLQGDSTRAVTTLRPVDLVYAWRPCLEHDC